jgi:hypothetical protein
MSFWLSNPLKLFDDINLIPRENQPYAERLNILTRLILLISIILYMLKIKESLQFLIFGIVLIIILYYSQRDQMQQDRESFVPQSGVQTLSTPIGQIIYDINNGPGSPEYRKVPIVPPSPAMPSSYGGYNPKINTVQESIIPQGYSDEIRFNPINPNGLTMLPPVQKLSIPEDTGRENLNLPSYSTPPSMSRVGHMGSIGLMGEGTKNSYRGTALPFNLSVEGNDPRFSSGNNLYIHRKVISDPSHVAQYTQPLNRGGGLESIHEFRESTDSADYRYAPGSTWNPTYIGSARSAYQREVFPNENDDRTGPYRSATTYGSRDQYNPRTGGAGDGFREIGDLAGNDQYYLGNPDPFAGMFAIRSEASHMDMLSNDGTIIPMYRRDGVKIDDYIEEIGNRQHADELLFRDSMLESVASKIAETDYSVRMGPVRGYPGSKRQ